MGAKPGLDRRGVRFGVFELDVTTGELRKHGIRIRLQDQPLKVLLCLIETPGSLVTREELTRRIWPEGTFVDYEHGLNTAVTRLRQVLADSADNPRYVETVGRKGYRFIAPLEQQPLAGSASLEGPAAPPAQQSNRESSVRAGARSNLWLGVIFAALAVAAALGGIALWRKTEPDSKPLIRVSIELPPETPAQSAGPGNLLALSPDGSRLALTVRGPDGRRRLAVRRLDQDRVMLIPETDDAGSPFFSSDGKWIGFFAEGKMKKINVDGGSPITLADAFTGATGPQGIYPSANWGDDGNIVASLSQTSGLVRVPAGGGPAAPMAPSKKVPGEIPRWPQLLPGSHAVLFTSAGRDYENGNIDVLVLRTGERKTVQRGGFRARYLPNGYLVYIHQNRVFAVPFDLRRLTLTGTPRPVLEDIADGLGLGWHFDGCATGNFVYLSSRGEPKLSIFSMDRSGRVKLLHSAPGRYGTPRFSPDGKRLAFSARNGEDQNIWVEDVERRTASRLTSLPGLNNSPVWTRDGRHILFRSVAQPTPGIYAVRADGSGEVKLLLKLRSEEYPSSITPDGKRLAIWDLNAGGVISTVSVETDNSAVKLGDPVVFHHANFSPSAPARSVPAFSPDGRWLAYGSNESGRVEIYVTRFPGSGPRVRVSTIGGVYPVWSPNGKELIYKHEPSGKAMVVKYSSIGGSFVASEPKPWSDTPVLDAATLGEKATFDVSLDGEQIAAVMYSDGTATRKPATSLTFLLNFFDELARDKRAAGH